MATRNDGHLPGHHDMITQGRPGGGSNTESRTYFLIQEYSELNRRWEDISGQLTAGYASEQDALDAFEPRRQGLHDRFGYEGRYRVVKRTVTETAREI